MHGSTPSETDILGKSFNFLKTSSLDYNQFQSDDLIFPSSSCQSPKNEANNNEPNTDITLDFDDNVDRKDFYKEEDEQQRVKRRRKKMLIDAIKQKHIFKKDYDDGSCRLDMNNCAKKINLNNSAKSREKQQQLRHQVLKEMIQEQNINMNEETERREASGEAKNSRPEGTSSRPEGTSSRPYQGRK